jgi:hypothetical protein
MAAALNKSSPWLVDSEFDAASGTVSCGFRVIEAGDLRPEMFKEGSELERIPLLVRGFTSKWPAHQKWERSQLIELFGNKVEHFIYMSSAGVYKKSLTMPHVCALHTDAPTAADEQATPPQHEQARWHSTGTPVVQK